MSWLTVQGHVPLSLCPTPAPVPCTGCNVEETRLGPHPNSPVMAEEHLRINSPVPGLPRPGVWATPAPRIPYFMPSVTVYILLKIIHLAVSGQTLFYSVTISSLITLVSCRTEFHVSHFTEWIFSFVELFRHTLGGLSPCVLWLNSPLSPTLRR